VKHDIEIKKGSGSADDPWVGEEWKKRKNLEN
jgi:hypothetical protein